MKKLSVILLSLLIISCQKVDLNEIKPETTVSNIVRANEKGASNMLLFEDLDELNSVIHKLSSMTDDEIQIFEKRNNYVSFSRICNQVYDNIDFDSFKSSQELLSFLKKKTICRCENRKW